MLAARDADLAHPMRDEEEAVEAFTFLRGLEREGSVAKIIFKRRELQANPPSGGDLKERSDELRLTPCIISC
jgi:hypothetical protein